MFETYEPLMTVKEACDALHVGKNTSFGFGRYTVKEVVE